MYPLVLMPSKPRHTIAVVRPSAVPTGRDSLRLNEHRSVPRMRTAPPSRPVWTGVTSAPQPGSHSPNDDGHDSLTGHGRERRDAPDRRAGYRGGYATDRRRPESCDGCGRRDTLQWVTGTPSHDGYRCRWCRCLLYVSRWPMLSMSPSALGDQPPSATVWRIDEWACRFYVGAGQPRLALFMGDHLIRERDVRDEGQAGELAERWRLVISGGRGGIGCARP
jgi:hypothetical protein